MYLSYEEEERVKRALALPREETYAGGKDGRIAGMLEGLNALTYARNHNIQGPAAEEVMNFHKAVEELVAQEFTLLKITRTPIGNTGALHISVSISIADETHTKSYTCLRVI